MSADNYVKPFVPLIQGTVSLLAPFLEVAIHDITTGKITAIYGNITNRNVGNSSPVNELQLPVDQFPDFFDPYYETNWDGRKIKCTTVTVRNEHKQPVALICFNFDVSVFQTMEINLKTFLKVNENTGNPVELYSDNWQDKIDSYVTNYLSQHKLILGQLTRDEKKMLIEELSNRGVFFLKNAAPYVANKLSISRATVYNYLKVLRAND